MLEGDQDAFVEQLLNVGAELVAATGAAMEELYYPAHRGVRLAQVGGQDQAIRDWEAAIRHDPKLVHAYRNLGMAHAERGDVPSAVYYLNKAIELKTLAPPFDEDTRQRLRALQGKN